MTEPNAPDPESLRLAEDRERKKNWKRWGPYLSERQWGTVREDYSPDGSAWAYFPHDAARSRSYRWGEDGIAGISDRHASLCALDALKAGKRPETRPRATWAALHRRRYAVYRLDLTREEFHLLGALAKGQTLGAALRAAARACRKPLSPRVVTRAFRIFTAEGLLNEG